MVARLLELFGQNLSNSLGQLTGASLPFPYIPATLVTVVKPRTVGLKVGYTSLSGPFLRVPAAADDLQTLGPQKRAQADNHKGLSETF